MARHGARVVGTSEVPAELEELRETVEADEERRSADGTADEERALAACPGSKCKPRCCQRAAGSISASEDPIQKGPTDRISSATIAMSCWYG